VVVLVAKQLTLGDFGPEDLIASSVHGCDPEQLGLGVDVVELQSTPGSALGASTAQEHLRLSDSLLMVLTDLLYEHCFSF
jgi:hypothetical protein